MLFSTRAEYGVRLMVELGRQSGDGPVSLSAIAEQERLPLSYLEHLVAKLRNAGLVESQRGAHGGYRLGRPAGEIDMLVVVQALEGAIAPMECFHETPEGKVSCSHETDGDQACATKFLWTRVQGGVTKALSETTLADMVEFAGPRPTGKGAKAVVAV
jgi:Rrf2 family cysteine metabolism transcriptional repressor